MTTAHVRIRNVSLTEIYVAAYMCRLPVSMAPLVSTLRGAAVGQGCSLFSVLTRHCQLYRVAGRITARLIRTPARASSQWLRHCPTAAGVIAPLGLLWISNHGSLIACCRASVSSRSPVISPRHEQSRDQLQQFDWWRLWRLVAPDLLLLVVAVTVREQPEGMRDI